MPMTSEVTPRDGMTMNDDASDVVTKHRDGGTFGNYRLGFIRLRKRSLKGYDPSWREYRPGVRATASTSFDLVRAVRVDGKPRHDFVLGLGSIKN